MGLEPQVKQLRALNADTRAATLLFFSKKLTTEPHTQFKALERFLKMTQASTVEGITRKSCRSVAAPFRIWKGLGIAGVRKEM